MIKGLGRIILIAVGAFMLVTGIVFLVTTKAFTQFDIKNLGTIILQIVTILAGLSAAFAGIKGEGGFWFTIFSLIMLGTVIYFGVTNAARFSEGWNFVAQFIVSLIVQILYALGFIFVKIGK